MASASNRIAALRDRTERRTVAASAGGDAALSAVCVVAALALAFVATYVAGGSKTALPHLFYVPVIVASIRFGARGSLPVAVLAGLAAGPLMPLDTGAGTVQASGNWLTRLAIFVIIGQITAYLTRHSLPSLSHELGLRRLRSDIEAAIDQRQLRLEYQPIIDLHDGGLAGAEALIRWDHPERGLVSPINFIGDAERAGCIGQVTRFVIAEACRQVSAWRAWIPESREFKLSVNVSASDLSDDALPEFIAEVLQRTGLPNRWLNLEITETALVADIDAAVDGLMRLRMLGIRLGIDDFGTGESSLAYLRHFPIDVIKIDRAFVHKLDRDTRGEVLVRGIVALATGMDLTAVVEGIETTTQARAVRSFGCPLAQGYLFSRPLRSEVFEAILNDQERFQVANCAHLLPAGPAVRELWTAIRTTDEWSVPAAAQARPV